MMMVMDINKNKNDSGKLEAKVSRVTQTSASE